ncbi:MAG: hypothetical protein ACLFM2_01970, partial [Halothece sp.]
DLTVPGEDSDGDSLGGTLGDGTPIEDVEVNAESVPFTVEEDGQPPQFVGAPFTFETIIVEEAEDGDEVGTVEVEDLEGVSFDLIEGNEDVDGDGTPAFDIDDDGVVTIADVDDLEESFQLTVEATNEFGSAEADVTIPVDTTDENDPPIITPPDDVITITDDFEEGDEVFTVEATDPEGDEITFEITDGNTDVNEDGTPAFDIDDDGVVTVQDADDLEAGVTFDLDIVATDDEGEESDPVTFSVEVTEGPDGNLDVDANGQLGGFTDGLSIFRFLNGLEDPSSMAPADNSVLSGQEVLDNIDELGDLLDVDENGQLGGFTDGLSIFRFLNGLEDPSSMAPADNSVLSGQEVLDNIDELASI